MKLVVGGEGAVEVRDTNSSAGQRRAQSEGSLSIACESRQVSRNVHWEAKTQNCKTQSGAAGEG